MKRLLTLLCLLAGATAAAAADSGQLAPGKNFVMALFTRENHRSMTFRGSEMRVQSADTLHVTDFNLTVFVGDASNRIESILLSPAAVFETTPKIAHGDHGVRLIRDDLEAAGTNWTYDHAQKKVSLRGAVRVVFNAELKSLLK